MTEPTTRVVNASALRLREAPDLASKTLGSLPRGTVVTVVDTAVDGYWSQVQAGRRLGWMASKYLVAEGEPTAPKGVREEFPWMPIALGELGVREALAPGASNPRVLEYLRSTDLDKALARDDSTPWCSGFVNWCVEKAGLAGTNSARARSWLDWGRSLTLPRRGCVVVLERGAGGHVGFFMTRTLTRLQLFGGNQTNSVGVAGFDPARLLGYRVPA